jgi:SlyX protein
MQPGSDADARLVQIESLLMHMQHDVEQLSTAVIEQQAELDAVKRQLSRLQAALDAADAEPESRDPQQERPPHY